MELNIFGKMKCKNDFLLPGSHWRALQTKAMGGVAHRCFLLQPTSALQGTRGDDSTQILNFPVEKVTFSGSKFALQGYTAH